jgi:apolipoprotein N-acyltransferase
MAEIPIVPDMERRGNSRERRTTACSVCIWIIVLIICSLFWIVGTDPKYNSNPETAFGFLVLMPFILIGFVVSLYKICRNASKWYNLGG